MAAVNFFPARLSSLTVTPNDVLLVHSSIMIIILEDTHLVSLKTREVLYIHRVVSMATIV